MAFDPESWRRFGQCDQHRQEHIRGLKNRISHVGGGVQALATFDCGSTKTIITSRENVALIDAATAAGS